MTELVRRTGPTYYQRRAYCRRPDAHAPATACCLKNIVHLPPVSSITTATIIKAAWAYVLAQVSGSSDVVFGHTISGRNAVVDGVAGIDRSLSQSGAGACALPEQHPGWTAQDLLLAGSGSAASQHAPRGARFPRDCPSLHGLARMDLLFHDRATPECRSQQELATWQA